MEGDDMKRKQDKTKRLRGKVRFDNGKIWMITMTNEGVRIRQHRHRSSYLITMRELVAVAEAQTTLELT